MNGVSVSCPTALRRGMALVQWTVILPTTRSTKNEYTTAVKLTNGHLSRVRAKWRILYAWSHRRPAAQKFSGEDKIILRLNTYLLEHHMYQQSNWSTSTISQYPSSTDFNMLNMEDNKDDGIKIFINTQESLVLSKPRKSRYSLAHRAQCLADFTIKIE